MASIIRGYEYDIFISYRHNDNRSYWVTEFISALKEELAATIKEPVSVYFDTNPHDGLLETHNVDKSLESKLKCLIFIPIISQTYCDPKSFAWQNEFCAFNKLAKYDKMGMDIKLSNGNVTSRILPLKIHDLHPEDVSVLENELGGALRAIDFIYREPGVNRPLKPFDNKNDNQNKTDYKNQVNKVANAISEIIRGVIVSENSTSGVINESLISQSRNLSFRKKLTGRNVLRASLVYILTALVFWKVLVIISGVLHVGENILQLISLVLIVLFPVAMLMAWFFERSPRGLIRTGSAASVDNPYPDAKKKPFTSYTFISLLFVTIAALFLLFPQKNSTTSTAGNSNVEKSIAVLPFDNLSNDPEQEYFSDGMVDEILDQLFKVGDLKVISRTSSIRYKHTKLSIKEIAHELGVSAILEGSVRKIGNNVRITLQLIDTKSDTHLWSETYDRDLSDVFSIQAEVAQNVARNLKASMTSKEASLIQSSLPSSNQEAYDFYLKGIYFSTRLEYTKALEMYTRAIEKDSMFTVAYAKRAMSHLFLYWNRGIDWQEHGMEARKDIRRGLLLNPGLPELKVAQAREHYYNREYEDALKIISDLKIAMPNMSELYTTAAYILRRQGKWDESIIELVHGIQLDPFNGAARVRLIETYGYMHKYDNQIESATIGLNLIPDYSRFKYYIFDANLNKTGDLNIALKESGLKTEDKDVQRIIYYYTKQYEKLIELILKDTLDQIDQINYIPKALTLAYYYHLSGNGSLSIIYADTAIRILENKLKEIPDDDRFYASLGICKAFIGKYEEAISCGEKAISLKPLKLDALQGIRKEQDLMNIYIITGNYDQALKKIDYLLSVPSYLSIGKLKTDPLFDNLRSLPRFQKIIDMEKKKLADN